MARSILIPMLFLVVGISDVLVAVDAAAQDVLPPVVVITPSPVAKPPSAPKPAKPEVDGNAALPKTQSNSAQSAKTKKDLPTAQTAFSSEAALAPLNSEVDPRALSGTLLVAEDTFVPVTVVTNQELLSQPGATITDTLDKKPGIVGSTFSAGASRPIIRGLDNFRVRVQENGIGTHDVSALSEDHAVPVDPFSADRVEVVRGPASLRYGSQAIGGVVAIENQRIPTVVPLRGVSGEIRGGISSFDEGREGAFKATAGAEGIVVTADGFKRKTDDYQTPRGRQLNTFVDSEGYSVGLSRIWSSGFVGVAVSRTESLYGIPGEEAVEVRPRIDLEQDKLLAKGEWRVRDYGLEAIRIWFGASDYAHNEVIFDADGGGDIIGTRFRNNEQEARAEVQHSPVSTIFGELSGAIGAQWGHKKTSGVAVDEPIDALLDPSRVQTVAGFWFEELAVNRQLRLQAAARIENTKAKGRGLSDVTDPDGPVQFEGERSHTPLSASLGALYQLPLGVVARLTGQYVERAPDAAELFSKGVHEATGTFEIGNPNLSKEKATTIEIGFQRAKAAFRFDASAFYSRYQGFIFKSLTGAECGETLDTCNDVFPPGEETLDQVIYSQRDATFYGAEVAAQYDVGSIWRGVWGIDGQYDFVRARFEAGGNVPRIPPHRVGGGIYYRDSQWSARAGVLHALEQNETAAEEISTPGYTLVSAEIAYTTKLDAFSGTPGTQITLGAKGENLADDDVLNHSSFKRREDVLLPGASFKVFGSIKFN